MVSPSTPSSSLFASIQDAHAALRPQVAVTPLVQSHGLSSLSDCELYLKCEHLQHTGSFKFRGASNKVRLLEARQRPRGLVTASSGNHGQGLALAGRQAGVAVTVYASGSASPLKLDAIRALGATVITLDLDPLSVELEAARQARLQGALFVSPYNDQQVIAGQGTIGMELAEQLPELDAVFVAVGGGGMISGIGTALRQLAPRCQVIGCWPSNAPTLQRSLEAGHIIEMEELETLSDGTAGGVEPDSITFPLCQALIDATVLVSEDEIREAMRLLAHHERWIVEGAAGVALAGALQMANRYRGKRVAVVLCGRNIMLEKFLGAVQ
ncbi:threonine/serine dehydratase [Pseudomonas capeferrum]|uniref:threonine/serine dehydratase n=1 Tax=Pseudomonas capeferrum TaxID=1495066 RepID=UPI0015E4971C|nr:threonine/serine dehydratase [Pseudomonas capeferrum]MBA1205139.1 threonine/serine dehydratase [Pseudomonas capeferrum]